MLITEDRLLFAMWLADRYYETDCRATKLWCDRLLTQLETELINDLTEE